MSCVFVYRSICLNLTWYQSLGGQGTSPPQISYWIIFFLFCRYNFEMISSLMRQGLKELWTRLDITFGIDSRWSTSSTISILDPKISASTLSDEVVQDKEDAEASTQSIQIEDSLHAVTPSPDAPEVHDISDISSSHIAETEEDIRISDIEEKYCCISNFHANIHR